MRPSRPEMNDSSRATSSNRLSARLRSSDPFWRNRRAFAAIFFGASLLGMVAVGANSNSILGPQFTIQPPVITAITDQLDNENDSVNLQVLAVDPEGDPDLTYDASNLPPGLMINSTTGLIDGTLTFASAGVYSITVTVSDSAGNSGMFPFMWTVTDVNRPPSISPIGDETNDEGDAVSITPLATDPDGDNLVFMVNGLPPGLTIDPNTCLLYTSPSPRDQRGSRMPSSA